MKRVTNFLALLAMMISILFSPGLSTTIHAQARQITGDSEDKTLSPFFFVKSNDAAVDQLPLKATSANVNISGVIADVAVTQVYKNEGKRAIEAVYIFPASTRTAVTA